MQEHDRSATEGRQSMSTGIVVETPAPGTVEVPEGSIREFSYHDRCDRCGFQAYYVAQMETCESVQELLFCKHHGDSHTPAMAIQGWTVHDFTHMLYDEDRLTGSEN